MPAEAQPLPGEQHDLPAGIAMVSFWLKPVSGSTGNRQTEPPDNGPPYAGASGVDCVRGAAGELLELIARP
jgi:hypothetical protein